MSYYGGTITVAGRDLITSLVAGETIEFTRIVVGSGSMPENIEPIDMTDLVNPVAEGTSTIPMVENGVLNMTIEYRNDMNGGLKEGFWLSEFAVYAKTAKIAEVMLYFATLGDSPQPVNAYRDNRIDIRRYPVTIALEVDADIQVTYNPGAFVTAEEAQALVSSMVSEAVSGIGSAIIADISIPSAGWAANEQGSTDGYGYCVDVAMEDATETQFPSVALHKPSLDVATNAGLCSTAQTLAGALRFWAKNVPAEDMTATVALLTNSGGTSGGGGDAGVLPATTTTRLGGVRTGDGIEVTDNGKER